jgi:hypothetical protein
LKKEQARLMRIVAATELRRHKVARISACKLATIIFAALFLEVQLYRLYLPKPACFNLAEANCQYGCLEQGPRRSGAAKRKDWRGRRAIPQIAADCSYFLTGEISRASAVRALRFGLSTKGLK